MTAYQKQISIIIVNYNVRYFIEQCLQSVFDACTHINAEIIVVDNNSKDDSCTMIKRKFPSVILIENKKNTGFSTANNQGVRVAKGEYVLILNPDTVVAEDTFIKIIDFAKSQIKFGALGVKLIDGTGHFLPESKRGIPTPITAIGKLFGFYTNKYYATHISENANGNIEILVGAFMLLKREVYNEVNGFDEDYFMYGEDIDLSYKILKKGYNNYYFSDTKIIHYKGESTKKNLVYLNNFYGAMQIFYNKHFNINPIVDFVYKMGIVFWRKVQIFKVNSPTIVNKSINRYIYIGNNETTYTKIKLKLNPELAIHHTDISMENILANTIDTVIFDNNFITNKKIIETMEKLKNNDIFFRFIPKNCEFIIGSDKSNLQGGVINF